MIFTPLEAACSAIYGEAKMKLRPCGSTIARFRCCWFAFLLIFPCGLFAQQPENAVKAGIAAFERKAYAEALVFFERAAKDGNADAMYRIGHHFEKGLGAAKDIKLAKRWYEEAARRGSLNAMVAVGYLFANGLGVPKSRSIAFDWYSAGAIRGSPVAMFNLGLLYHSEDKMESDGSLAMRWYIEAAARGNSYAMNNIGAMYSKGFGVKLDYCKAKDWTEKAIAADATNEVAQSNLGHIYLEGKCLGKDIGKARELLTIAAKLGYVPAKETLDDLDRPSPSQYESSGYYSDEEIRYVTRYEYVSPPAASDPPISPFYGSCHNPMGC